MGGPEFVSLHPALSRLRHGHEVTVVTRGQRGDRLPAAGVRAIPSDRTDPAGPRARLAGERGAWSS
jgi:hypothetical protein